MAIQKISSWIRSLFDPFALMPFGRKILLIFSFLAILGCFVPWYSDKITFFSALNHLEVFGYSIVFCLFCTVYIALREHFKRISTCFSFPNIYWYFLLLSLSLYTVILKTTVLYELLLYSPDSRVEWGVMTTFICIGMALFGAFFSFDYTPVPFASKEPLFPSKISKDHITLQPEK